MNILVTGATGYVGGRLIPDLLNLGHRVRCMVRDLERKPDQWWTSQVEFVEADATRRESLDAALEGIEVAYFLIHAMAGSTSQFEQTEIAAASNFGAAAKENGTDRIIYLGGLQPKTEKLSAHLKSRIKTGEVLRQSGVSVTEFRAGVIVGSGSLSFELIRYLTERVPILITPKWVTTRTQPIAVRDVISYLTQALVTPGSRGEIVEIGGVDVLTYAEMFSRYAGLRGLKRPVIKVPVLTPRLSSLWVGLVTPINSRIAKLLISGLDNEVVVTDDKASRLFDIEPISYDEAVQLALTRFEEDVVETHWSGSVSSGVETNQVYSRLNESEGLITESNTLTLNASNSAIYEVVSNLGGETGWLYGNLLWRMRGLIDFAIGGVGMRKSRRSKSRLQPGDTMDFWRVERVQRDAYLLLRAEMKLPGTAWLEFSISEVEDGRSRLTQTAYYEPKGLPGLLYWYLFTLPHRFIFPGMIRRIGERALVIEENRRVVADG